MDRENLLEHFVKTRGHRVSMGTDEYGLHQTDALAAVDLARRMTRAISGGDVYLQEATGVEPAYANWDIRRNLQETFAQYSLRSWEESVRYISQYPMPTKGIPLFVIALVDDDLRDRRPREYLG